LWQCALCGARGIEVVWKGKEEVISLVCRKSINFMYPFCYDNSSSSCPSLGPFGIDNSSLPNTPMVTVLQEGEMNRKYSACTPNQYKSCSREVSQNSAEQECSKTSHSKTDRGKSC